MAVKEQRPAVKRMKKGSSFFGYTDTSWNARETRGRGPQKVFRLELVLGVWALTYRAVVPCRLFLCILGTGKTDDPSPAGKELSGRLQTQEKKPMNYRKWV